MAQVEVLEVVRIVGGFKPGDTVFVEVDRPLPAVAHERLRKMFSEVVPHLTVVVLEGGIKVVTPHG